MRLGHFGFDATVLPVTNTKFGVNAGCFLMEKHQNDVDQKRLCSLACNFDKKSGGLP